MSLSVLRSQARVTWVAQVGKDANELTRTAQSSNRFVNARTILIFELRALKQPRYQRAAALRSLASNRCVSAKKRPISKFSKPEVYPDKTPRKRAKLRNFRGKKRLIFAR